MNIFGFDPKLPRVDGSRSSSKGVLEHTGLFAEAANARKPEAFHDIEDEMYTHGVCCSSSQLTSYDDEH